MVSSTVTRPKLGTLRGSVVAAGAGSGPAAPLPGRCGARTALAADGVVAAGAATGSGRHVDRSAPALAAVRGGIQRTCELLEQMLNLARVQEPLQDSDTTVSLRRVLRQVLEDLMPLADEKNIDPGVEGENDAHVLALEADIKALVEGVTETLFAIRRWVAESICESSQRTGHQTRGTG